MEDIRKIAGRCGFRSRSHFTRAFVGRFGMTPTRWRRRALPGRLRRAGRNDPAAGGG